MTVAIHDHAAPSVGHAHGPAARHDAHGAHDHGAHALAHPQPEPCPPAPSLLRLSAAMRLGGVAAAAAALWVAVFWAMA